MASKLGLGFVLVLYSLCLTTGTDSMVHRVWQGYKAWASSWP